MTTYIAYVDGSCPNNGKPNAKAGWGAYLINPQGDTLELAGPVPAIHPQTNSRAELLAPLMALRRCKPGAAITIVSDSQYVVKGAMEWLPGWKARGWRKADKKEVEHRDLWELIDQAMQERNITSSGSVVTTATPATSALIHSLFGEPVAKAFRKSLDLPRQRNRPGGLNVLCLRPPEVLGF